MTVEGKVGKIRYIEKCIKIRSTVVSTRKEIVVWDVKRLLKAGG